VSVGRLRPDQLDLLTLSGPELTEAAPEVRFGLSQARPGLSRLRPIEPSSLLTWQLTAQTTRWATEDSSLNSLLADSPVIDPDVTPAADIQPSGPEALGLLLAQPSSQLDGQTSTVTAAIADSPDPDRLAAAIAVSLPSTTLDTILELQGREKAGGDAAAINGAGLDRAGYQWLLRMANIVQADEPIVHEEWKDTIDALTGEHTGAASIPRGRSQKPPESSWDPTAARPAQPGPSMVPLRFPASARQTWVRGLKVAAPRLATRTLLKSCMGELLIQSLLQAEPTSLPPHG
jgi:hypothetical protein